VSDETDETDGTDDAGIIKRTCAGRCGVVLSYRLERGPEGYTSYVTCIDGCTAYRGGHLCIDCDVVVSEALASRRERRQRTTWARERSARKARVPAQKRGRR